MPPGVPLVVPGVPGPTRPQPRTSAGPWDVPSLNPGPGEPRVAAHPGPWLSSWGPCPACRAPKLD